MNRIFFILLVFLLPIIACKQETSKNSNNPKLCQYVDQTIGIASGRTVITAAEPFGMISPGPHFLNFRSRDIVLDSIDGFSHIHTNGTGCGDKWGSIYLMPISGELDNVHPVSKISGSKDHPGFYKTHLDDYQVDAEVTATARTAVHKYTFNTKNQHILFDISKHLNSKYDVSQVKVTAPNKLEGYLSEGAFCSATTELHKVYFFLELDHEANEFGVFNENQKSEDKEITDKNIGAWFSFDLAENSTIEAKLSISYVSIENAKENLQKETAGKSFDDIKNASHEYWNDMLSRIIVEGSTEDDKKQFYSGLFRMLLAPMVFNDVNGEYLSFAHYPAKGEREVKKAEKYTRYSLFSSWDTYRNVHPFLSLVYPEYQLDMVKSMLGMYQEKGWLPKWEHFGVETYNMNGAPASIVICDTYLRGIIGFDTETAYDAIKKESTFPDSTSKERNRPGREHYLEYGGWIPQDFVMIKPPVWGPVSTTLEYNLADWNFAQFCRAIGKDQSEVEEYLELSKGYKNFFHPELQLLCPKNKKGNWYKPFDPNRFTMFCKDCPYVEGNAWNYSFAVPHDVAGLIELFGSKEAFVDQLQKCFDDEQFHIGNEPDINYPYLFNYVEGEKWRTQKTVREVLRHEFNSTTKGIPGEEDVGTLSAWQVYAMLGFYPYCPGNMNYQLTSPVFDKVTIKLNQNFYPGDQFVISSQNNSAENFFINSMQLNGKDYPAHSLSHDEMVKGGELIFELSKDKK